MKTRPKKKSTKQNSSYNLRKTRNEDDSQISENDIVSRQIRSCRISKSKSKTNPRQSLRLRSNVKLTNQIESPRKQNKSAASRSPVKKKTIIAKPKIPSEYCNFCFTTTQDDHLLGEMKTLEEITAHKFCLYFSPGLSQNGEPTEGLWGFIPDDIRKELRRGTLLKCSYCGKKGAVVGCSIPECVITFHLPCGMANDAFFHYHQQQYLYPSYCKKHRPKMTIPVLKQKKLCTICQEYMKNCDRDKLLYINCCHSYFHRECLVNVAYHQGEFNLKCPNCNNKDEFVMTIKECGIYVPCRDPTWEITGEVRLNHVEFQCSAQQCLCENGRDFNGDEEWELFSCDRCGSNAIHVSCAGLQSNTTDGNTNEWFCSMCQDI